MSKTLTATFRRALRYAATSIADLAREAGYSPITFDTYVNRHPPSAAVAVKLAETLEARAAKLQEHATRLRGAADDDAGRPRG